MDYDLSALKRAVSNFQSHPDMESAEKLSCSCRQTWLAFQDDWLWTESTPRKTFEQLHTLLKKANHLLESRRSDIKPSNSKLYANLCSSAQNRVEALERLDAAKQRLIPSSKPSKRVPTKARPTRKKKGVKV